MFTKYYSLNSISFFLIDIICFLFLFKYTSIYTGYSFLFSSVYFIVFFSTFYFIDKIQMRATRLFPFLEFVKSSFLKSEFLKKLWIVVIIIVFIIITFTPRLGEIGRYPAIVDWLARFFRGEFPYNSPSAPSSFPFLFFIASPFYLIGNVGYLEVIGLLIFAISCFNYSKNNKEIFMRSLLIFVTPVIFYSIIVRSELFTNSILFVGLILLLERYGNPRNVNKVFFFYSILFGLALATRSIAGPIYAIYLLYYFKNNIQNLFLFSGLVLTVFVLTIIPFILWDKELFFVNGPFAIQSHISHLPMLVVILILLISIYLGYKVSDLQQVFFACGVMMFISVFISMMIMTFESGFYNTLINDFFDLSYFEFALPFLIFSIKYNKNEKLQESF